MPEYPSSVVEAAVFEVVVVVVVVVDVVGLMSLLPRTSPKRDRRGQLKVSDRPKDAEEVMLRCIGEELGPATPCEDAGTGLERGVME